MKNVEGRFRQGFAVQSDSSGSAALGLYLGKKVFKAILERRDKMQAEPDTLVKDTGDAAVCVRN